MISIRPFALRDTETVISLWQETGLTRSWNNPHRDIQRKMSVQPELFPGGCRRRRDRRIGDGRIRRAPRVDLLPRLRPRRRGEGIGRHLVEAAEHALLELGCPGVQLMVRPENEEVLSFYDALGYERSTTTTTGKRLIPD